MEKLLESKAEEMHSKAAAFPDCAEALDPAALALEDALAELRRRTVAVGNVIFVLGDEEKTIELDVSVPMDIQGKRIRIILED